MNSEISNLVHNYYWKNDYNCARTTLLTLGTMFNYKIEEQLFNSAVGMHGAGGYQAQCGIVEGTLLFIGVYGKSKKTDEQLLINICKLFAEKFEKKYGSLSCKILRPIGFKKDNPPHACEDLTIKGIDFSYKFINEELISLK